MKQQEISRLRGLKDLLCAAVEEGASAVERVHRANAERPFSILRRIPALSQPAEGVQRIHDAFVTASYGGVRAVTRVVDRVCDVAIDALPADDEPGDDGSGG